ncbi:hypothetical protein [Cupriavidus necator]
MKNNLEQLQHAAASNPHLQDYYSSILKVSEAHYAGRTRFETFQYQLYEVARRASKELKLEEFQIVTKATQTAHELQREPHMQEHAHPPAYPTQIGIDLDSAARPRSRR